MPNIYLTYVKFIATEAPTFFGYIISFLASVSGVFGVETIFDKIGHSDRVPLVKERYLMTKLFNSASCCKIIASCKTLIGLQFTVDYSFNLSQYGFDFRFLFLTASFSFDEFHKISYLSKDYHRSMKLIPKVIRIYLDLNLLWQNPLHTKDKSWGPLPHQVSPEQSS